MQVLLRILLVLAYTFIDFLIDVHPMLKGVKLPR